MSNSDTPIEETVGRSTAPRFLIPTAEPVQLTYGAATHVGKVRSRNEDHFAITRRKRTREILATNVPLHGVALPDDEAYMLVVADGVGGEGFGDLASQLAVRAGWDSASRAASWLMRIEGVDDKEIRQQMVAMAQAIQQAFLAHCHENPQLTGMATTWTCAYIMGWDAIISHVGDSRAYHCHGGGVAQITRDHTLAEELRKSGMGFNRADKFRSVLTKAFGGESEEVVPDVHQLQLKDGDAVLLCSDGLSNTVTDTEIGHIVFERNTPQDACDALIAAALERGAPDNVTAVLARVQLRR
jgi:PPM family protein phosphatase